MGHRTLPVAAEQQIAEGPCWIGWVGQFVNGQPNRIGKDGGGKSREE